MYPDLPVSSSVLSPGGIASGDTHDVHVVVPRTQTTMMRTVQVLHLINGEHYSGAERVQDLLALHLPKHGYEIAFACLKPGRFPTTRLSQSPLWEIPMQSRHSLGIAWQLAGLVRRRNIPLLHSHTPRTALIGCIVSRLTRRPLVHHIHSPTSRDSTRHLQNRLNTWVERIGIGQSSMLITVSQSLADWLARLGVSRERVQVVPNGVPAARVLRSPIPPHGTWVLGSVALFRPRKGIEVLLHALADLRMANLDLRLRAVGPFESEDYERTIRGLAKQLRVDHAIDWIGFTSDVAGEFARMDLHVLPSLFGEGLPMVILEAMAAGVPTVATKVEGIPEAIRADIDGVLVPPDHPAALAGGIRRVMSGELDWQLLRQNALQRHAEQFSADAMAAQVAQVYDRVMAKNHDRMTQE